MKFIEELKKWKILIGSVSSIIIFSVSSYTLYIEIYDKMEENNKQIELTLITILKSQIKDLEMYPCKTSREEWADYNMLLSQYFKLMKKHNPLLIDMKIKPIERLTEDSCKCFNGLGDCSE